MSRETIFVIGGAGYVGSHVCKYLYQSGLAPVVYDNLSTGNRDAVKWGELIIGDIRDKDSLYNALKQHSPKAIMHFAADSLVGESVYEPSKYYDNNVYGALVMLQCMKELGIRSVVFSSTCNVYQDPKSEKITEKTPLNPTNPYGRSKFIIEMMLKDFAKAYNINYAALRYFNAAGCDHDGELGEIRPVETHLIPLIMQVLSEKRESISIFGTDYPTKDGTGVRDYIHVKDLAIAHLEAMNYLIDNRGENLELNLGSGKGYTVLEVIDAIEEVSGIKVSKKISARRDGDVAQLVANPSLAENMLGWKAQHSGLRDIIESVWNREKISRLTPL